VSRVSAQGCRSVALSAGHAKHDLLLLLVGRQHHACVCRALCFLLQGFIQNG
jgi:hypothetical protein